MHYRAFNARTYQKGSKIPLAHSSSATPSGPSPTRCRGCVQQPSTVSPAPSPATRGTRARILREKPTPSYTSRYPRLSRPLPAVARLRGGPLPPSGPAGDSRLLSATHLPPAGCRADTDLPFYFLLKGWISRFFTPYESISEPRSSTGCLNLCCSCSWGMMI